MFGVIIFGMIFGLSGDQIVSNFTLNLITYVLVSAAILYLAFLAYMYFRGAGLSEVCEMLEAGGAGEMMVHPFMFLAMEYWGLILNRSFLVFIMEDGLYGWKFHGVVSADAPNFYQPVARLVRDEKWKMSTRGLRQLVDIPGNFFIPRSQIETALFNPRKKWGMGPIKHSGRIEIALSNKKKREFILLGLVDGEEVRNKILSLGAVKANAL